MKKRAKTPKEKRDELQGRMTGDVWDNDEFFTSFSGTINQKAKEWQEKWNKKPIKNELSSIGYFGGPVYSVFPTKMTPQFIKDWKLDTDEFRPPTNWWPNEQQVLYKPKPVRNSQMFKRTKNKVTKRANTSNKYFK